MKIHPALTQPLDAPGDMHHVPIALMRYDGKRHDVRWRGGRGDEHRVQCVLAGLAVNVTKALDGAREVRLVKHHVVIELLCDGPAAQHAQMWRTGHRFAGQQKLDADKRLRPIDEHAFALLRWSASARA